MSGFETIIKVDKLRETADKFGFVITRSRHGYSQSLGDVLALKPKSYDDLPIYNDDAELYVGTLESLEHFFRGIQWAREYDRMLRVSTDKQRERKEQDWRNFKLAQLLKNSGKKE